MLVIMTNYHTDYQAMLLIIVTKGDWPWWSWDLCFINTDHNQWSDLPESRPWVKQSFRVEDWLKPDQFQGNININRHVFQSWHQRPKRQDKEWKRSQFAFYKIAAAAAEHKLAGVQVGHKDQRGEDRAAQSVQDLQRNSKTCTGKEIPTLVEAMAYSSVEKEKVKVKRKKFCNKFYRQNVLLLSNAALLKCGYNQTFSSLDQKPSSPARQRHFCPVHGCLHQRPI